MARKRRSRLPFLLFLVVVGVAIVWWRQEQAKREAGDSFAESAPPVAAPAPSKEPTVVVPKAPAVKQSPVKKPVAKKPAAAKKSAAKKPAAKKPAQRRGAK